MEPTATTPWTAVGAEIADVLANVDLISAAAATTFLGGAARTVVLHRSGPHVEMPSATI
jgi:hypothetical protein